MSWKEEYPFASNYWESPEGKIHYVDERPEDPEAPVVVMVHGNPTWSFFYRRVIAQLRATHRCIVPDHLGCGLSDKPAEGSYTLSAHIKRLQGLLRHLGVGKAGLIVHDWGGPIGLGAFLLPGEESEVGSAPLELERVTILNTSGWYSEDVPGRILLCRLPVLGEWIVRGLNGFAWPATWMAVKRKLPSVVKEGFLHPYGSWGDRVAVARFVQDIPRRKEDPAWPVLHELEANLPATLGGLPVQIIWGMQDFCFHAGYFQKWKLLLPGAEVHPLEEAGHYLLEDESERCLELIGSFWAAEE